MKTLVTGAFPLDAQKRETLENLGLELTLWPDERKMPPHPETYEAVICNGLFAFHDISAFSALRVIQLTSAGLDRVPLDYIRTHGIQLYNAAGVYSVPMAEWTVMRLLELYKCAADLWEKQTDARWEKNRNWRELTGKRVCFVGFGAYAEETAKRLKNFGVKIIAVNRREKKSPWVDNWYPMEGLHEALGLADAVILAIALTEETRGILNREAFAAMKPGAVLLNAARGGLVEEDALLKALDSGKLAGAALDVFEEEPLSPDSPLWHHEAVLVSPHNSFVGEENRERLTKLVIQNMKAVTGI